MLASIFIILISGSRNCTLCNIESISVKKLEALGFLNEITTNLININNKLYSFKEEFEFEISKSKVRLGIVKKLIARIINLKRTFETECNRILSIFPGDPFIILSLDLSQKFLKEAFSRLNVLTNIEDEIRLRYVQINTFRSKIQGFFNLVYSTKYGVNIDDTYYSVDLSEMICILMKGSLPPMITLL